MTAREITVRRAQEFFCADCATECQYIHDYSKCSNLAMFIMRALPVAEPIVEALLPFAQAYDAASTPYIIVRRDDCKRAHDAIFGDPGTEAIQDNRIPATPDATANGAGIRGKE